MKMGQSLNEIWTNHLHRNFFETEKLRIGERFMNRQRKMNTENSFTSEMGSLDPGYRTLVCLDFLFISILFLFLSLFFSIQIQQQKKLLFLVTTTYPIHYSKSSIFRSVSFSLLFSTILFIFYTFTMCTIQF